MHLLLSTIPVPSVLSECTNPSVHPGTPSCNQRARSQLEDKSTRAMHASTQITDKSGSIPGNVTMHHTVPRVLSLIAKVCDISTKAILCRLSKQTYNTLKEILYRCVDIQRPDQLDVFARFVADAENNASKRALLAGVECFIYRPVIHGRSLTDFTEGSTLFKLSRVPRTAADGEILFPALCKGQLTFDTASPDPSRSRRVLTHRTSVTEAGCEELRECFLACLKHLFCNKIIPDDHGDLASAFYMLGFGCLTTVTITYGLEPGLLLSCDLAEALEAQKSLETVIIDIEEFLDYHMELHSDQSPEDELEFLVKNVRHGFRDFKRYKYYWPNLREVILILGKHQWQSFIPSMQMQIARDPVWDLKDKEFVRKKVKWRYRNGPGPCKIFPHRNVKAYLGLV